MQKRIPVRKIPASSFAAAAMIVALSLLAAALVSRTAGAWGAGEIPRFALAVIAFYAMALAGYRLFLRLFPLTEGPIVTGRPAFSYCTYMLLNIFVFFPVLQSSFVLPFPFRRFFYLLLGARLGQDTHFPGVLLDPPLTEFGDHVVIGFESLFYAHAAEGNAFSLARIRVGNRATIGARAIVMPGVTIGDDAIVGAGAVVTKGTRIGPGEFWGGVPARRITPAEIAR